MNLKPNSCLTRGGKSARAQSAVLADARADESAPLPVMTSLCQPLAVPTVNVRSKVIRRVLLSVIALACVTPVIIACFSALPAQVRDHDLATGRVVRLTHTDDSETNPTWSPDGSRIAFECYNDGFIRNLDLGEVPDRGVCFAAPPRNICIMNADGSGRRQLTDDRHDDTDPAWSPDGWQVAFVSDRDGTDDIFVINADGSGLRRVTNDMSSARAPAWSPDGSKIAFSSNTGRASYSNYDKRLFVVDADGSNLTQIADSPGFASEPSWSPDGSRIAFVTGRGVYVMNLDGTGLDRLYRSVFNTVIGGPSNIDAPVWSPDGETIAFVAQPWNTSLSVYRNDELYIINADGSGMTRITHRAGNDFDPAWSADGSKLAFASEVAGNPEIYVMVDLETQHQELTDRTYSDGLPVWSPDGTRVAFVDDRDGDDELYILNADRSGTKQITVNNDTDIRPAWSPDGSRLAFVSDLDGDEEIYVMNADGSGIKQLTANGYPDSSPAWSPDGSRIAYVSLHNGWHTDIFVVNDDRSGRVQLTFSDELGTHHYYGAPTWSPDGTRIAFISAHNEQYRRHVMNADGTQQVTADVKNCSSYDAAQWSPDSTRIAFECRDSHIHIFNPSDGTDTALDACHGRVLFPSWSRDGTHIAFACSEGGIYKINVADGVVTQFHVRTGSDKNYRSWSPDTNRIAFFSKWPHGYYDIDVSDVVATP